MEGQHAGPSQTKKSQDPRGWAGWPSMHQEGWSWKVGQGRREPSRSLPLRNGMERTEQLNWASTIQLLRALGRATLPGAPLCHLDVWGKASR